MSAPLTSLERALRVAVAALALAVALLANVRANAAEHWRREVLAEDVAITVHVVSSEELLRMMHTVRWDSRTIATNHKGHARLYRNRETGAWTCHVYVNVDATEETLEHERRHCHGWVHR